MKALTTILIGLIITLVNSGHNRCRADLIIDFANVDIGGRSTGSIDVFIRSSDDTVIDLAGFQLGFRIADVSPPGAPASGRLIFAGSYDSRLPDSPTRQNNAEQSESSYVFHGLLPANNNFSASVEAAAETHLAMEDSTLDFSADPFIRNARITSAPLLLARLELVQNQSPDTAIERGQYQLSLIRAESRFYDAEHLFESTTIGFSSSPGTVNVTSVPEPGACWLFGIAFAWAISTRRRSFRRHLSTTNVNGQVRRATIRGRSPRNMRIMQNS